MQHNEIYFNEFESSSILLPLIFKCNEEQITVREVLNAIERQPLFGHTTGRHGKTMWMCFIKLPINSNQIE